MIAGFDDRKDLAAKLPGLKLGHQTIGKIERGERPLRPHEAAPIAQVLDVPISFLLGGQENEPDPTQTLLERVEMLLQAQNDLLARQSDILKRIEAAIALDDVAAQAIRADAEELRRLTRELVRGRPEDASGSPRVLPQPEPSGS